MKIPERMFQRLKEVVRHGDAALPRRSLKTRPFAREDRKRGETPLRMVQRTRAAKVPGFGRQNQSLQIVAMGPPTVPELAHIFARRLFVDVDVGSPGNSLRQRKTPRNPQRFHAATAAANAV